MNQLQDTERFTLTVLGNVIEQAGWYPDPTTQLASVVFPSSTNFPGAALTVHGVDTTTTAGDSVAARFLTSPNDGLETCTGASNTTGANVLYENVFTVDASGNLTCSVNGAAAVILTGGVSGLQVVYGVKRTLGAVTTTFDTYLPAGSMTVTDWANVVCIKITVAFVNPLVGQPGQTATVALTRVIAVMNKAGVST